MPCLSQSIPKYRKHRASGQAIVSLNGRDHYLGPHGTKASRLEYDRLIRDWLDRGRQPLADTDAQLLVVELVSRYWSYVKTECVRHGKPTEEQVKVKPAVRHLLRLYENHQADSFGPRQLNSSF